MAAEKAANEVIWQDTPVDITFPAPDALARLNYRSKKALTGQVRIVAFPGADCCACCGTHVRRGGEVGIIKVLSCQKFREGVRLEILCGSRAYRYLSQAVSYTHHCQTAGPGYCTRNGPPPDRRRNRSAARRNRRIRGYLSPTTDTSPCRRGPAAGQKRPFPHSSPGRGLPPDRCRSGRSAAPARCCHTRCRQTQPNPQARQRAPPARAWSPSPEAW